MSEPALEIQATERAKGRARRLITRCVESVVKFTRSQMCTKNRSNGSPRAATSS
jgi:hypothetical protein